MVWCALRKESSNELQIAPSLVVTNLFVIPFMNRALSRETNKFVTTRPWPILKLMLAKSLIAIALVMFAPLVAQAQSGVLIPSSTEKPDPAVLSLDEMTVNVVIDNQYARVRV